MAEVRDITKLIKRLSREDEVLIKKAYDFAERAHFGQKRYSGEPYFNHIIEVAKTLAEFNLDAKTIAAGLLHDTLEDGLLTDEEIGKNFGEEILSLVQGVTKLGKLKYRGLDRHVESLRKFFLAVAKNINVVVVKLSDRLHNVKTLEYVPEAKRKRIAMETLEIYAPIADRLGIWKMKADLEDYSFRFAYPKEYAEAEKIVENYNNANEEYLKKFHRSLAKTLAEGGIRMVKISHRLKHLYSLYRKWLRYNKEAERIYDIVALRVVVPTIEDCYKALGIIHKKWQPLPGRIKDFIASPKPNGYQSLHTTIFTGDGGTLEIQIRTEKMHDEAEFGIASHLAYKASESGKNIKNFEKNISWIKELAEWQRESQKSGEYLKSLQVDFFKNRVFVFTPKGDVIDLPEDSSPIDFAYAIHSDVGNHISGAKVNGKMVSLETKLKNGDIVEISIKESARPSAKWLYYAKTSLAKKHIKAETQKENILTKFIPKFRG